MALSFIIGCNVSIPWFSYKKRSRFWEDEIGRVSRTAGYQTMMIIRQSCIYDNDIFGQVFLVMKQRQPVVRLYYITATNISPTSPTNKTNKNTARLNMSF